MVPKLRDQTLLEIPEDYRQHFPEVTNSVSTKFFAAVALNDIAQCAYTGMGIQDADVDHLFPKDKYPDFANDPYNLFIVDRGINRMKSNMTPNEFYKYFSSMLLYFDAHKAEEFKKRFTDAVERMISHHRLNCCVSCFAMGSVQVHAGQYVCVSCGTVHGSVLIP